MESFVYSFGAFAIIASILFACLLLWIFYALIRIAVAHGMRDHQRWMEKHRPQVGPPRVDTKYASILRPPSDLGYPAPNTQQHALG